MRSIFDSLCSVCEEVRDPKAKRLSIRELAQLIGKMVSSFPAVRFGPLHYRHLEQVKKKALKQG